jgi:2'-5' RNA ligase
MPTPVSIWLIPAEPERAELSRQIARLAAEQASTPFPAHVTLFTTEPRLIDASGSWNELLREIAARHPPLTLTPTGTSHSTDYFKTLFFEFRTDPELVALQADVRRRTSPAAEHQFSPHMSLLYKQLPAEVRASLALRTPRPGPLHADTLVAMIPGDTGDWHDIAGWREIARQELAQRGSPIASFP